MKRYKLKRALTLRDTTLYGVGIILGAGIYALLGSGAGITGNSIWISFVLAAFIAVLTGMSYAELSSMYPKEAAEYN
ncbi:MAG: amino acid transporter, partial [Candidatus Aenigmarchaeota archaeon]|nr:amino acid transporter [Candidatus Aenigmarchaeota archaeon]MDI6722702.1 amino acid transporter [Candidatus Aenigmarchaeota archaeon]